MSFLYANSCECTKSDLDIFAGPIIQTSEEDSYEVHCKPIAPLSDDGAIEFVIAGSGEEYIDLAHTKVYFQVKVSRSDKTDLPVDMKVGPVNYLLHSLIQQCDIYLNNKLISPPSNAYPYRAYIEAELNYDKPAKDTHLTCALYYKDTPGKMDDLTLNKGLEKRSGFMAESKVFDLIGHLHSDLFNQPRQLINGVDLKAKLTRTREVFHLMSETETNLKTQILDATLIVRKVRISPSVLLGHEHGLRKSTAKYPISRVDTKVFTIAKDLQSKSIDNIYLGQIPKRVILGFVSNTAFNGDFKKNPFNFQHFHISFLSIYLNGQQIPSKPFQPDFSKGLCVREYETLFSGTGINHQDEGNHITRHDYSHGYTLFAFDLSPDQAAHMEHWSPQRNGNMRLEVRFEKALTEPINCIVYAEFNNVVEIDHKRNVVVDFNN